MVIYAYQLIKSFLKYKLRCKEFGFKSIIYNPIKITCEHLIIGDYVRIYKNARLEGVSSYSGYAYDPVIKIGSKVSIEQNLHLTCANYIEIGENTGIAGNVTITDIIHPYKDINIPIKEQPLEINEVRIGPNCQIYNNVTILPGTQIGRHSVVGANSVVLGKKYPDYSVIAGVPAKILKKYNFKNKQWENM